MRPLTALLCLALAAPANPAPRYRPPPPPRLVGVHAMTWGGVRYRAAFCRDGHYDCDGGRWVGRWSLAGRTLTVAERQASDEGGREWTWVAELEPGTLRGRLATGAAFALEPVPPKE